jgi:hypothetical protein
MHVAQRKNGKRRPVLSDIAPSQGMSRAAAVVEMANAVLYHQSGAPCVSDTHRPKYREITFMENTVTAQSYSAQDVMRVQRIT